MRKILITGCSGYLGSHLVRLCAELDAYEVHGLDLVPPVVPVAKFYQVDVTAIDRETLAMLREEQYYAVIHMAGPASVPEVERERSRPLEVITNGTAAIASLGQVIMVYVSSGHVTDNRTFYGMYTAYAERLVYNICRKAEIRYSVLRLYNIVGTEWGLGYTNMDGIVPRLLEAMKTGVFYVRGSGIRGTPDGTPSRDYIHILDACVAIVEAIDKPHNGVVGVSNNCSHTVLEVANTFQQVNQVKFEVEMVEAGQGNPRRINNASPATVSADFPLEEMLVLQS